MSSAERLDLPDFLSIDSFAQGDFKYLFKSLVGGDKPYILTGFDVINPGSAIGTQNISIRVADSVTYYPGSLAGPFFHGLEEGNTQSTPLVPELRKNATNYVYLTLTTTEAAKDTRAFWDPDLEGGEGGEFTQDVNTQSVLTAVVNVSVSSFPDNTVPVCKVIVGPNFITSIEDARDMMFRLGSGGLNPDPLSTYQFRNEPTAAFSRNEPNTLMTSALDPNAFQGGDKNILSLKEWMDVVMTKILELSGTSYWYENTSSFSIINLFNDSMTTSIKSKGEWDSSDTTAGLLTWTEDVIFQSIVDKKDVIVRASSKNIDDNQVLYITQKRNQPINTGSVQVEWLSGLNYVNGQLGSFENLTKGDWIKKSNDPDYRFLRVEEFYASSNISGGVTSAGNALSIKLSEVYGGISEYKQAIYTQGEYLSSDVHTADRNDTALTDAGGDLSWLALRSDTILGVSNITTTQLAIDITEHDGEQAKCSMVAHGLLDTQRITISGSTNFDGTYQVEVADPDTFYILLSTGTYADELAQSAFYATVTTTAQSTSDGFQLESANHGFDQDQNVLMSNTLNYDGSYNVYVIDNTTFTIPVAVLIADETDGNATSVDIYVRTDLGPTKLNQGETKGVGELDSENLMSFIGMDNQSQTYPTYHVPVSYNTKHNMQNYNSDITDNLTQRTSKLTSMMADKTQDKAIIFAPVLDYVESTVNGSDMELTFTHSSGTPELNLMMSSSNNNGFIGLLGTLTLATNTAAYFLVDRNNSFNLSDLSGLIISSIDQVPLEENTFVFAMRGSGTATYLWDGTELIIGKNLTQGSVSEIIDSNAYDEPLYIISGTASSTNEKTGPVPAGITLILPNDSRDASSSQGYVVGQGTLEIKLNGQELISGKDFFEIGIIDDVSTTFTMDFDLEVDDILALRIDVAGGYFGIGAGNGSGEENFLNNVGGEIEVFKDKIGTVLNLRTLKAGTNMAITQETDTVTIINTNTSVGLSVVSTKTANATLTQIEDVVLVDATTGTIVISLPVAAVSVGKTYHIKKIDSTLADVIINTNGSEEIDGNTTLQTNIQYQSFSLVCNGSNWFII